MPKINVMFHDEAEHKPGLESDANETAVEKPEPKPAKAPVKISVFDADSEADPLNHHDENPPGEEDDSSPDQHHDEAQSDAGESPVPEEGPVNQEVAIPDDNELPEEEDQFLPDTSSMELKEAEEPSEEEMENLEDLNQTEVSTEAQEEQEESQPEPTNNTEDPELEEAITEVERSESDELLEKQDEEVAAAFEPKPQKNFLQKLIGLMPSWWHHKRLRNITLATLAFIIAVVFVVPTTRYFLLNSAGVRVNASLAVFDNKTRQPLKNVRVSLSGQNALTNSDGYVSFNKLKLGKTQLKVEKRAFAVNEQQITLGLGSNPLGDYQITPTGAEFKFVVTDWLSGKPIEKAEASVGDASALSNKDGEITLVLDAAQSEAKTATIALNGYRREQVELPPTNAETRPVKLVVGKKHLFVSKRTGKYDVYKIDADGKNEERLLAGTGSERDDMVLVSSPINSIAALVATRDDVRNPDGFMLSGLYLIDVETGELAKLAQSERVQIVDWIGEKLVYVMVAEGASGTNPQRHRLVSYDTESGEKQELAASNYFNDVLVSGGKVYYAPSNAYLENPANAKLFLINPDGSSRQTIVNREVWNVFRTSYDVLTIAAQQDWFDYSLKNRTINKLPGPPAQPRSKLYINNSANNKSLWIDERDGKGVLILYDVASNEDKVLETRSGLKSPVYWLGNTYIVFRVDTPQETADYVMSTNGGTPTKIRDVSNIGGIDRWYYY